MDIIGHYFVSDIVKFGHKTFVTFACTVLQQPPSSFFRYRCHVNAINGFFLGCKKAPIIKQLHILYTLVVPHHHLKDTTAFSNPLLKVRL